MGKKIVLITGFGPFQGHVTNASWEAVQLLPTLNIEDELSIILIVQQLPVIYSCVEQLVPKLKRDYTPDVTIHVGVYNGCVIQVEACAKRYGYTKNDIINNCPNGGTCSTGSDDVLHTEINLPLLSKAFYDETKQFIHLSYVAGNYLCEYVYYISLNHNQGKTLFVHVPRINHPYSAVDLAFHLKTLIKCVLKQLNSKDIDPTI